MRFGLAIRSGVCGTGLPFGPDEDQVGNRLRLTTDQGTRTYTYDRANRLLSEGDAQYYYDQAGNLTAKVTGGDEVLYEYNAAGKMTRVTRSDETYVSCAVN